MNKTGWIYIAVLFFFFSCDQEKTKDEFLGQVESYMESYPDSALALLKQIKHPEELKEEARADYALLLTQVLDKMYMDSLQSDSLIEIATRFYSEKKIDKIKAGKAFYYYGKVKVSKKHYSEALQAYLTALTFAEATDEYRLQGLIWEHVGYLNSAQGYYENSIVHFRKSIECYEKASADEGVLYAYRNIGRGYLALHKNDSARWYINRGLLLSDSVKKIKPSFFQLLGLIAKEEQQYSQAIAYFLDAINACNNVKEKYRYYLSLGRAYLEVGKIEEARDCFIFCRNAGNVFISSGAYSYLSEISRKGADFRKAFVYKNKSDSLLAIVRSSELRKQLLDLQSKYKNEKLILENKQVKLENEKQTYLYLFLLTFVAGVSVTVLVFIRKRYRKLFLRNIEIIRNNNRTIEEYACKIAALESAGVQECEAKKEEIGKLNRKILCLTVENKKIRGNSTVDALFVLENLKQGTLIIENLTASEREHIFVFLDLVYADFATRVKNEFKLTNNELLLAALLKVGFSNKQLMIVFDCEMKSVYKNRQRLKLSLGLGKDDSLDEKIMMY